MQNQDSGSNKDPSAIIDMLMKNPELIKMFASVLTKDSTSKETESNETDKANYDTNDTKEASTPVKEKDNPLGDLSSQLPLMMSLLRPMMQGNDKGDSQSASSNPIAGLVPMSSKIPDKKTALLLSLKPFLSQEKGEIINYIVTFEKMTEMFKDMK